MTATSRHSHQGEHKQPHHPPTPHHKRQPIRLWSFAAPYPRRQKRPRKPHPPGHADLHDAPKRRTNERPEHEGHADAEPRERVPEDHGEGVPPARLVALVVLQVLDLDRGAHDEAQQAQPRVRAREDLGHACVCDEDLERRDAVDGVREPIDELADEEVLVGAAEVVVVGARADAGQRLGADAEAEAEGEGEGHGGEEEVSGMGGGGAAGGDGAPGLVELVFEDTGRIALVGDGEDEDVEPEPEEEGGQV